MTEHQHLISVHGADDFIKHQPVLPLKGAKRLYREGLIHARRIRKTGYLSIRLSLYWRMLSKDNGQTWKTTPRQVRHPNSNIITGAPYELRIRGSCCPHRELSPGRNPTG
ncbi:MAG: ParE family toxin-like protein [Symbiopectobacterium sp.]|uniref:ParE family toxin-like protein n=1 Tax=Symbiopectobacterium sp. TaxID=2952789 RepID=UPI003F3AE6F8